MALMPATSCQDLDPLCQMNVDVSGIPYPNADHYFDYFPMVVSPLLPTTTPDMDGKSQGSITTSPSGHIERDPEL